MTTTETPISVIDLEGRSYVEKRDIGPNMSRRFLGMKLPDGRTVRGFFNELLLGTIKRDDLIIDSSYKYGDTVAISYRRIEDDKYPDAVAVLDISFVTSHQVAKRDLVSRQGFLDHLIAPLEFHRHLNRFVIDNRGRVLTVIAGVYKKTRQFGEPILGVLEEKVDAVCASSDEHLSDKTWEGTIEVIAKPVEDEGLNSEINMQIMIKLIEAISRKSRLWSIPIILNRVFS